MGYTSTQRELEAMSRDEAMEFLLSTYKKQIDNDNIVEQVIAITPAKYWGSLQGSKIVYSRKATPFAFYVASKQSKAIEGIQLKRLNTHRIKEKGWTGACAGPLQSPEGADETCRLEHEPGQASERGQGAWRQTNLSQPPESWR